MIIQPYSRFFDLRDPRVAWDESAAYVDTHITTPNGETLYGIAPPSGPCADFLIVEELRLWAGITANFFEKDLHLMKSLFELTSPSMVRFISPEESKLLRRYQDFPDWWRIEVIWVRNNELQMVQTQTDAALWYCKKPLIGRPKVVVLALESVNRMRAEVEGVLNMPAI